MSSGRHYLMDTEADRVMAQNEIQHRGLLIAKLQRRIHRRHATARSLHRANKILKEGFKIATKKVEDLAYRIGRLSHWTTVPEHLDAQTDEQRHEEVRQIYAKLDLLMANDIPADLREAIDWKAKMNHWQGRKIQDLQHWRDRFCKEYEAASQQIQEFWKKNQVLLKELAEKTDLIRNLEDEIEKRNYACGDALERLWTEIILARKPNYGPWEYPGQAYRHILAEFQEVCQERDEARKKVAELQAEIDRRDGDDFSNMVERDLNA